MSWKNRMIWLLTGKKDDSWASLFWIIALILFVRGFVVEPFKIPSGSMIPTLLIGDHIFVAKSSYDFGVPFTNIKLVKISEPKRGDVVVFEYPNHEQNPDKSGQYYIKRLIGVPGDVISFNRGVPSFNEVPVSQTPQSPEQSREFNPGFVPRQNHQLFLEFLPGMNSPHWVQRYPDRLLPVAEYQEELQVRTGKRCVLPGDLIKEDLAVFGPYMLNEICTFTVPEGKYFFVGDNRDDSADGREWGFVDRNLLKGRALFIWLSKLDSFSHPEEGGPVLRWTRLGKAIH